MSPAQVAQATNTSRRTVMRAIDAQDLQAFRDNRNHWKITAQAVEMWASAQCAPSEQISPFIVPDPPSAHTARASEVEELKAERDARRLAEVEAAELRGKLAATEAERDRLYNIVQGLKSLPLKPSNHTSRSWWPWKNK
ncbi:helix-turn-helix domain-containing protein [Paracoccus sediminilitoris]|uniref:helix-turn-helix domain-containing protein n=1 Tax=Paracoccus sediminilitoris TaxID=2202419 RepID=UPI0011B939E1|nr:helix-turn-helix domain-containing protein [Paracoccus sediminilitoris]